MIKNNPKRQRLRTRTPTFSQFERLVLHPGKPLKIGFPGRQYFSAAQIFEKLELGKIFSELLQKKSASDLRILEVGTASGRLTRLIINKYNFNPKNYVIGDIEYWKPGRPIKSGPFMARKVHKLAEKGLLRKLYLNLLADLPKNLGKFDTILIPNVFEYSDRATGVFLEKYLPKYLALLKPGGCLVANRIFLEYFPLWNKRLRGFSVVSTDGALLIIRKEATT